MKKLTELERAIRDARRDAEKRARLTVAWQKEAARSADKAQFWNWSAKNDRMLLRKVMAMEVRAKKQWDKKIEQLLQK